MKKSIIKSYRNLKKNITRRVALIGVFLVFLSGCSASNQTTETKTTEDFSFKESSATFIEETETEAEAEAEAESTLAAVTTSASNEETKVQVSANTYDKLLSELMTELSKKEFDSNVNDILIEAFSKLYYNYNNWQGLYKHLPTREEFIRDKLINSIKYIKEFYIYEKGTPETEQLIRKYGTINVTTSDNVITVDGSEPTASIVALHEIAHAEQNIEKNLSTEKYNYYYDGVILSEALREGEATFYMKFAKSPSSESVYSDSIEGRNGYEANYWQSLNAGYPKYANLYENLIMFAGYENLNTVKGENIPNQIEKAIAQNYGSELATEVMKSIASLIIYENLSYKSNTQYNQAIETQRVFLKCIEHDIDSLSNKNDVKKYVNIYRGYKLNNLLQITDSDGNNLTNEVFDIERLDEKLILKIKKYNAIPKFSGNDNLNKMALRIILMASHESYYESNGIYQSVYLPCNLDNTKYTYFEADGIGYVEFEPNDGKRLQIAFDDEEIIYTRAINTIV